jgi:hypothetical protein
VGVLTEVGGGTNDNVTRYRQFESNISAQPQITHTPSTPVSTAMRASSIWQRM